ncbi:MAG: hypothetical protein AVDCRST_MAG30-2506 [uncultured Solirubrobacteraceae bacterium]|uniref:Uncharacterized protein n=1 Tax=uncultured Solirubrobacteraceae bacterium TaxID=1162706 RepID=A0A6J4T1L1_9ACTN|nr:MAG: hypothetical protein AVDCRST_MAG30-2506 [uncultured Solirubrobacteraceae bacterium]
MPAPSTPHRTLTERWLKTGGPRRRLLVTIAVLATLGISQAPSDGGRRSTAAERSAAVTALLVRVDHAEQCHWERFGRYSSNVLDLEANGMRSASGSVPTSGITGLASLHRLRLTLETDRGGRSYVQRVTGRGVDTVIERRGTDFVDYGDFGYRNLRRGCS